MIIKPVFILGDEYNYHVCDVIAFSCNTRYELHGLNMIFCKYNGGWSTEPPTCVRKHCIGELSPVANG